MGAARDLIDRYRDIKTLPHVVTKLPKLISDSNTTMKDFEDVIKMDPTLVARLLRLVNSPYFGLTRHIDSIGRAVVFIGMKNLYAIAVTDALRNIFAENESSSFFSRQKLWLHCAAVGICSKMLAERIFGINGEDAYLCGILHDFGLIVESQIRGELLDRACERCGPHDSLPDLERAVLGTDHCEIGYLLTRDWAMSEAIQIAIRDHHEISREIAPDDLGGILQSAIYITSRLDYKVLARSETRLSPRLAAHIAANREEYEVLIEDLPDELSKARDIYTTTEH